LAVDADALIDCRDEKDLQIGRVFQAADGIRTHDLLHGKQTLRSRSTPRLGRQSRVQSGMSAAPPLDTATSDVHEFD
jgi:hypothetical protein